MKSACPTGKSTSPRLPAPGYQPQATSTRLPAPGCQPQAASPRLPAPGCQPQAASPRLPAPGYQPQATSPRLPAPGCQPQAASPRLPAPGYQPQATRHRFRPALILSLCSTRQEVLWKQTNGPPRCHHNYTVQWRAWGNPTTNGLLHSRIQFLHTRWPGASWSGPPDHPGPSQIYGQQAKCLTTHVLLYYIVYTTQVNSAFRTI